MDNAAGSGHLTVVNWLHENCTEGCTKAAMDGAAAAGHLAIVEWLHENRTEGCTIAAMDGAAGAGHLSVMEWLHKNRPECLLPNHLQARAYLESAAKGGYLSVVR
mmetsp:Transcript_22600/g.36524  ORF Transcript_22600/g.36524 Transcript_22600/m.36524 type:complete len:105 (-) Transcript_22600:111-425(-)